MMMNESGYGQQKGEGANQYPVIELEGQSERSARVGEPIRLTARVSDDGLPVPRGAGFIREDGTEVAPVTLMAGWSVYRGDHGHVTFEPEQFDPDLRYRVADSPLCNDVPPVPEWAASRLGFDGRLSVTATFDAPGTYVLRATAHDLALKTFREVTVNVTN